MIGPDPLTNAILDFVCLRNAALLLVCYLVVLALYLIDELGLLTFRSKRLEALFSRASLALFVVVSPLFMVVAMVFAFVWGFSC
jgi:hypothetical protein